MTIDVPSGVRRLVPAPVRAALRSIHRRAIFANALRRFEMKVDRGEDVSDATLEQLRYGWGNEGWSGTPRFLAKVLQEARSAAGDTLECGSGLSTLLLAIVAGKKGHRVVSLESDRLWVARVLGAIPRAYRAYCDVLHAPIKDYGAYEWYDTRNRHWVEQFALVVCDGPPATVKGGRYGLAPFLLSAGQRPDTILLDDTDRQMERSIASQWAEELGAEVMVLSGSGSLAVLRLTRTHPHTHNRSGMQGQ